MFCAKRENDNAVNNTSKQGLIRKFYMGINLQISCESSPAPQTADNNLKPVNSYFVYRITNLGCLLASAYLLEQKIREV